MQKYIIYSLNFCISKFLEKTVMTTVTWKAPRNSQKFKKFRNAEMQSRNAEI